MRLSCHRDARHFFISFAIGFAIHHESRLAVFVDPRPRVAARHRHRRCDRKAQRVAPRAAHFATMTTTSVARCASPRLTASAAPRAGAGAGARRVPAAARAGARAAPLGVSLRASPAARRVIRRSGEGEAGESADETPPPRRRSSRTRSGSAAARASRTRSSPGSIPRRAARLAPWGPSSSPCCWCSCSAPASSSPACPATPSRDWWTSPTTRTRPRRGSEQAEGVLESHVWSRLYAYHASVAIDARRHDDAR